MATLNVRLNDDDEKKLSVLLAITHTEKSALVRKLINDQWLALQGDKTFAERRGGHPVNLLKGKPGDSNRPNRKKITSERFETKAKARRSR